MTPQSVRRRLGIDIDKAREIAALANGEKEPRDYPSADHYYRSCYNEPDNEYVALYAINEVLETYGIEGWCRKNTNYRGGVSYCNTWDPYAPTVFLVTDKYGMSRFVCSDFATMAERYPSVGD